jgi:hypothetical protein
MDEFVIAKEGKLYLKGKRFQFLSFNTPNIHILENPYLRRTNEFEQRDTVATLSQMGGSVIRPYTFSIPLGLEKDRHIIVTRNYGTPEVELQLNEQLMLDYDKMLQLAREYNLKVIVPFIDHWQWWGGITAFAKLYGETDFYSETVTTGFHKFIAAVVNRNNTFTGIPYKNDPTILGWETGNELHSINDQAKYSTWTVTTAKLLKDLDGNHLVIDGTFGKFGWSETVLKSPFIDVLTNHYYPDAKVWESMSAIEIAIVVLSFLVALSVFFGMLFQRRKAKYSNKRLLFWPAIFTAIFLLIVGIGLPIYRGIFPDFSFRMMQDTFNAVKFQKAFFVGEVGFVNAQVFKDLFMSLKDSVCSGVLVWSLRPHSRDGGFCISSCLT